MLDLSNIWPEWQAVELLGEGSFGKVYRCVREEYGMKFESAVKVISIPSSRAEVESMSFEGLSDAEVKSYFNDIVLDFSNEIKLMFMLKGAANIVSVENYKIVERQNEVGWEIYILMEYLTSFVSYSKNKKFTEGEVKNFALDIINALDICSKYKVIHRDIKPDNIFVDRFGSFKLGDFGVAKQLESSMSMMSKKGTYSYMAPEVFKGEKYDFRADVYSLGMVMYKLLNRNKDPFIDLEKAVVTYKDRNEAIERRRKGERIPAPVDASPAMAAVILKACEFRAEDRYSSIKDFKDAVSSVEIVETVEEEPTEKFIEDMTVAAPGNEPTVFADDVETVLDSDATVLAEDSTVLADDEPIVMAEDVVSRSEDAESGLSQLVDNAKESRVRNKKKKMRNYLIAGIALILILVLTLVISVSDNIYNSKTNITAEEGYYIQAEEALASGDKAKAAILFGKAGNSDYSDAKERSFALWDEVAVRETVSAGNEHTVALKSDGTVVAVGWNSKGQCEVGGWSDIIAVSAGDHHTVALKSDGTVVAVGDNNRGQCDVGEWSDIIAVSSDNDHTIALKFDGTVVAVGDNNRGQCDVGEWTDIIAVSAAYNHTVGLKSDGTVVAVGYNGNGQCDVDEWSDIIAVSAGDYHTVALKSDGTVVAVGWNEYGQRNVGEWSDVVAVSAAYDLTVALKSDGTVVAVGWNEYGQRNVGEWSDVVAVSAGHYYTVALKSDGTVVAVGNNRNGQCDIDTWSDIKIPQNNPRNKVK